MLSTAGWFAMIYFVIIALLYYAGTFFPYQPSFLHEEVLIPVTIGYIVIFFGVVRYKRKLK